VLRHPSEILSVSFDKDGKLLAAGTDCGMVIVWRLASQKVLRDDFRHEKRVNAVAFNPTIANRLVSASDDGTVKVWEPENLNTSEPRHPLPHNAAVTALAFQPNGKVLATTTGDNRVQLWYGVGGKIAFAPVVAFPATTGGVSALTFQAGGIRVAVGNRNAQVVVSDVGALQSTPVSQRLFLSGHRDVITGIAFRPGHHDEVATASRDRTVKVWDLSSRRQVQIQPVVAPPYGGISSVSFSGQGKFVAAGGWDGWAKVVETENGREAASASVGHRSGVHAVAYGKDGKRLLTGSLDGTARVWDPESGHELRTLAGHTRGILGVAYSPDGLHVATASQDGTTRVWDAESGALVLTLLHPPQCWPVAVAYNPKGDRLATGGTDGVARVWNAETGEEVASLTGHQFAVNSVAFAPPDGKRLFTGGNDGTARVWDIEQGKELFALAMSPPGPPATPTGPRPLGTPYASPVNGVAYSPDGKQLATGRADGTVQVWDASGAQRRVWTGDRYPILSVAFSPDGKRLAAASGNKKATVWELDSEKHVVLTGHTLGLYSVAFRPDGKVVATASEDRTTRLWDVTQGQPVRTLDSQVGQVSAVAVSRTGRVFAIVRNAQNAFLLDAARSHAPRELGTLCPKQQRHRGTVTCIAFSWDENRVVTGSSDRTAKVWDTQTGHLLSTCAGEKSHTGPIMAVAFAPDGGLLATGGSDKLVKLWQAESGAYLFDLGGLKRGHSKDVRALAFSHDGKRLASGSQDQRVKVWEVSSAGPAAEPDQTLPTFESGVLAVAFSPNDKRLAVLLQNGIKVWDFDLKREILYLADATLSGAGNRIAFRDDDRLLTVDAGGRVREYSLDLDRLRKRANERISPPGQRRYLEAEADAFLKGD
jgi:WD40 repeat protein